MAKKKRLRTWVKVVLVAIPVIAAIVCLIVFAFKLKDIHYTSDLNEFTTEEVKAYFDANDIDNSFTLWFRDLIGKEKEIDLFEDYDVSFESITKLKIEAHEKQFKGYIKNDDQFYCFDEDGKLLKIASEKIKNKPKVKGLKITNATLYKKIGVTNKKQFDAVLQVANGVADYDFQVKKITVNKNCEVSIVIGKVRIDLGTTTNLKKKLSDLNDMSKNLKKYKGVLNMKFVNNEGKYILKRDKKSKNH
ncbi:MAG: cell division protein FtsQ/DivIB [Eubacterium sp.]|nr:cell division protein FtsQ/DivIB [Eubacterium sp.]